MKKAMFLGLLCILATGWTAQAATYGVFVGLNEYSTSYVGSDNWLSGCVPDANHIYTNTIKRGGWTAGTVTKLLNSAGTKTAIRLAITNRAATAVAGDTFLYYHSSHGGQNSGKSVYLCSYNADYQDTELAADLAKFATGVKVIVVVDACHSGGLFQSSLTGKRKLAAAAPGSFDLAGRVMQLMAEDRAARLAAGAKDVERGVATNEIGWITAANYDQYSWDGDTGGLFTDKFIEGWTNSAASSCDLNGDGYANFYELYDYSWDVANSSDYEYTTAMAANTNVLLATIAGWIGAASPGGLVVFSNLTAQSTTVGQTLVVPVGAYTSGTTTPAIVAMTTVQAGASYAGGNLTFTPAADGVYTFNFTATNATGGSASASLAVTASLAAPTLSPATGVGNDRFTANWSAVSGAASYLLDVATAASFSAGGSGTLTVLATNINTGLTTGWEYVNGASNAGTYHKLIAATDPGVVSPAFATTGYTNALANFSVATFGGATANGLVVSYSLNGGGSWTAVGTNSSASASSPYVSGSIALPEAALGQASVRVKWHCPGATGSIGLRLQNLNVAGAQPAGGSTLVLGGQSVAGTAYTVTGLAMGSTYYYRVRAVGNLNGPYSTTGTVATAASDSAPAFAAIAGQAATVGALFTLDVAGYASGYPVPTLALVSSTANGAEYSFAGGTLSFTPGAAGDFAFVFRASNTLGVAGATANVAVAAAPVYVPTASIANRAGNSFTVNWTATTGGSTYQVQVATDNVFTARAVAKDVLLNEDFADFSDWTDGGTASDTTNSHYGAASPCRALGTGDTLTSPAVNYPTQLTFYVDASSGGNNKITTNYYSLDGGASWNPIGAFTATTAGATVVQALTSAPNLANATNVQFRFASAFNTWYLDDVAVTGGGGGGAGSSIIVDQTVSALTYGVTGLTPSTPYYVRVRASGGTWSDIVSTTTTAGGGGGTPNPQPICEVTSPTNGCAMGMQIATQAGVDYALEYTTNLMEVPPVWVQVDLETGSGESVLLQDADSLGIQRYYRIVKP